MNPFWKTVKRHAKKGYTIDSLAQDQTGDASCIVYKEPNDVAMVWYSKGAEYAKVFPACSIEIARRNLESARDTHESDEEDDGEND